MNRSQIKTLPLRIKFPTKRRRVFVTGLELLVFRRIVGLLVLRNFVRIVGTEVRSRASTVSSRPKDIKDIQGYRINGYRHNGHVCPTPFSRVGITYVDGWDSFVVVNFESYKKDRDLPVDDFTIIPIDH